MVTKPSILVTGHPDLGHKNTILGHEKDDSGHRKMEKARARKRGKYYSH